MNIIDIQDQLKNFSENQLIKEMQMPTGNAPQFLVLSEIQRRKRVRDDFSKRQAAQEPTVAEEAVAAAGVPMQGIAGMSEAMAPQSAASEGIGTIMPQAMRPQAPPAAPVPDDIAMGMRSGGLMSYGEELSSRMSNDKIDPFLDEVEQMATDRFGFEGSEGTGGLTAPRPAFPQPVRFEKYDTPPPRRGGLKGGPIAHIMPHTAIKSNQFRGPVQRYEAMPVQRYDEGGVVKAQKGAYFPSNAELYGLYGQESGYGKNMYGSSGEIGPLQIMPTTAIQPGYGIKSLFPELQKAVQSGDYESALAAYKANKAMVDEALMSGQKVEPFVMDYLDKAEAILGNRDLALLSYNQGIAGTEGFEGDPSKTDYVSGVASNKEGYKPKSDTASSILEMINPISKANASTITPSLQQVKTPMPDIPQDIIKDQTGRAIGDASYGPRIRAAMETGNEDIANNLVAQGLNEANFFEQMYRNRDPDDLGNVGQDAVTSGVAGITTPVGPGTIDPGQMLQVLPLDPTQKTISVDSTQSDIDKADAVPASTPQTAPVQPPVPASPKVESEGTSLEAEILKMQDDLKKGREQDKWLAIAQAGLALMSSKEPTLLGAAGEAGVSGLKAYRESQDRYQEGVIDLINARSKLRKSSDKNVITRDVALREAINLETDAAKPENFESKDALLARAAQLRGIAGISDISLVN